MAYFSKWATQSYLQNLNLWYIIKNKRLIFVCGSAKVFKYLCMAVAVATLGLSPASAATTTIDFDNLSAGDEVGGAFAAAGVTFVDAKIRTTNLAGMSGANTIYHSTSGSEPTLADPIIALFDMAVSSVSITGIDVGFNGLRITAYDALSGGTVLDIAQVIGVGSGSGDFFTLLVEATGIRRVEIAQVTNGGGEGVLIDNFAFGGLYGDVIETPIPAAAVLFLSGFASLGFARRRKQKKQ
jgi:hypothetical protein